MINLFKAFLDGLQTPSVFWKAQEIFRCTADCDWDDKIELLENELTVLGNGANGVTIATADPNKVLKIFQNQDYGYLAFLDLCLAYKGGSNLPVVYWVRDLDENFKAVLLERLDTIEDGHPDYDKMYNTLELTNPGKEDMEGLDEEMLETIALLREHKRGVNKIMRGHDVYLAPDMHSNNAMLRGETLVITDPWC